MFHAINAYTRTAKAFLRELQEEEHWKYLSDEDQYCLHCHRRRELKDELIELSPLAEKALVEFGLDPSPLLKCTLTASFCIRSSERNINRFQDDWTACAIFLKANLSNTQKQKPVPEDSPERIELNEEATRLFDTMCKFSIDERVTAKQLFESNETAFRGDTAESSLPTRLKRLREKLPKDRYWFTIHENGSYGFTWTKKPKS